MGKGRRIRLDQWYKPTEEGAEARKLLASGDTLPEVQYEQTSEAMATEPAIAPDATPTDV